MLQRRLLGLVRQGPLQVTLAVVLALCATACAVGQALVIATILRRVFRQAPLAGLYGLAAAAVALVAGRAALLCARDLAGHWTAAVIKTWLRDRLYVHLLDLGPGFTLLRRSGDLQATVADGVEAIQEAYIGIYVPPQAAVAIIAPAALVGIMISIDPVVGLVLLGGALVVPIARPLWRKILGVRGKRTWDAWAALAARMLDALQGVVTLKDGRRPSWACSASHNARLRR
ncbi:MAG: ABC transporter transmembrane domain-containing protein [Egibacteraceae bacterium]